MTAPRFVIVGPVRLAYTTQVECLDHGWRFEGTEDGCRAALAGHKKLHHR